MRPPAAAAAARASRCSCSRAVGPRSPAAADEEYLKAQERPRLDLPPGVMGSERIAPIVIPPAAPDPQKLDPQPRCLDYPPQYFARTPAAPGSPEAAVRAWGAAWAERKPDVVMQAYAPSFQSPGPGRLGGVPRRARGAGRDRHRAVADAPGPRRDQRRRGPPRRDLHAAYSATRAVRRELTLARDGQSWRIVSERTLDHALIRSPGVPAARHPRDREKQLAPERHQPRPRHAPGGTARPPDALARQAPDTATQRDIYDALSLAVREELAARWLATQRRVSQAGVKRICYLSVEFLLGRTLINGLSALDGELVQEARDSAAGARLRSRPGRAGRDRPGPRQRRPRPARRVLPRFARDAAVRGRRLRHPLRLRHLHAGHRRGRPAARDREQLAAAAQPVGNPARRCALRGALRRPLRRVAGRAGHDPLSLGRHAEHLGRRLRPAHPGQSQPDRESPAALVGPRDRAVQRRDVQRRPTRRGLGRGTSTPRTSRASSTRTTRRRRARSCASSSSTSS